MQKAELSEGRKKNYKKFKTEGVASKIIRYNLGCKSEFFNIQRLTFDIKLRHKKCLPPSLSDVKDYINIFYFLKHFIFSNNKPKT